MPNRYDTLIPLFNGWFITTDSFDLKSYSVFMKRMNPGKDFLTKDSDAIPLFTGYGWDRRVKKWGVVDSLGRVIVPFICDAVREYENGKAVFSIYKESHPLNTGLPRYNYVGYYFLFDRNGLSDKPGQLFRITTVFVGDYHTPQFVIEKGNNFYLPYEFHKPDKKSGGALQPYIKRD